MNSLLERMEDYLHKKVIGFKTVIRIKGRAFPAKVDTGATISSIDEALLKQLFKPQELSFGDIKNIKNVNVKEKQERYTVYLDIVINGDEYKRILFNVADRNHMKFPILLGKNALRDFAVIGDHREKKEKEEEDD